MIHLIAALVFLVLYAVVGIIGMLLMSLIGVLALKYNCRGLFDLFTPIVFFYFLIAWDYLFSINLEDFILRRFFHKEKPEDGIAPKSDSERIQELEKRVGDLQKKNTKTKRLAFAAIAIGVYLLFFQKFTY